jgi:hypothetical protein
MLQFFAWLAGIGYAIGLTDNLNLSWWIPLVIGLCFYPGVWLVGHILPRLALSAASGFVIGSVIAAIISATRSNWSLIPGFLVSALVSLAAVKGQSSRIRDAERRFFGRG